MNQAGRVRPSEVSLVLLWLCLGACANEADPELVAAATIAALMASDGGACAASDLTCNGFDDDCDGEIDEDYAARCMFGSVAVRCVDGIVTNQMCTDSSSCTVDSCSAGACRHVPIACADDGNPCTVESCDLVAGCVSTPAAGLTCDDGNACTEADACDAAGACQPGTAIAFDDGNACTADSCDPSTGVAHLPEEGMACDDGNACTDADACDASGACAGSPGPGVDDGNLCTEDLCDPLTGEVTHTARPNGFSCSDGDDCNGIETCQSSMELTLALDGKQTFYRADNRDTIVDPHVVVLSDHGLAPGRTVELQTIGVYEAPIHGYGFAAFSADETFLPRTTLKRVPGAVQSGAPAFLSKPTYTERLTTDFPEDFRFDNSGMSVVIPDGARYLFIGNYDSRYSDNTGIISAVLRAPALGCVALEPADPDMCGGD